MKTKKHFPRASFDRIHFLDAAIASGKYPNTGDLAKECWVSPATIYRDIEYMRERLRAPVEYCAENRGWYYTEKFYRLPVGFASANDMLALDMTKSLISLYRDTPLYEPAQRILNEITAPLIKNEGVIVKKDRDIPLHEPAQRPLLLNKTAEPLSRNKPADAKKAAWYEKRIVVPPVASAPVNKEIWDVIVEAMKKNRLITFKYKGRRDKDYNTRLVMPYQLLFDTGAWYLYGYSEERSDVRLFLLSRIKNASLADRRFVLPEDFDYLMKSEGSYFGIFLGEKKHYRIAFTSGVSMEIQERKWAADQKIEAPEDGSGIIIDFSSAQYEKILAWALSFGMNAHPVEPPELVDEWKENILAMYEKLKER